MFRTCNLNFKLESVALRHMMFNHATSHSIGNHVLLTLNRHPHNLYLAIREPTKAKSLSEVTSYLIDFRDSHPALLLEDDGATSIRRRRGSYQTAR